jgi:amidophosphoribosyltransferase
VTGDVTVEYLNRLEQNRNDGAKESRSRRGETVIELYNTA